MDQWWLKRSHLNLPCLLGSDLGSTCHDSKVSTCCCRPALRSVIELQRWTRNGLWDWMRHPSGRFTCYQSWEWGNERWKFKWSWISAVVLGDGEPMRNETCVFLIFSQLVSRKRRSILKRNPSTFQPMRCLTSPFVRATRKQFVGPRCHGRHGIRLTTARPGATWKVEIFRCRNVVLFVFLWV